MSEPNYKAIQCAGALKAKGPGPYPQLRPSGGVLLRYLAGGSWIHNLSKGRPSRKRTGNSGSELPPAGRAGT